jgi:hypothetical protein
MVGTGHIILRNSGTGNEMEDLGFNIKIEKCLYEFSTLSKNTPERQ